jgi:hypothetical protein
MPDSPPPPPPPCRKVCIEQSSARCLLQGTSLTFEFTFQGDRWRHTAALSHGGLAIPVLASLDGAAEDATPPSPAFQDLRLESFSDSVHEFQLMGQCGAAIYSAAARFDDSLNQVEFDVYARWRKPVEGFRAVSSYVPAPEWHGESASRDCVTFRNRSEPTGAPLLALQAIEAPDAPPRLETWPAIRVETAIEVGWPVLPPGTLTSGRPSLRWHYRIALISPGG